jgi:hypothetical protein
MESLLPNGSFPSPGGRYTPTFDIDIHNNLKINTTKNSLFITGQINGDDFPSAEAFVTDRYKTSIFLGVAPTAYGPVKGPMRQLISDGNLPMIYVNLQIAIDNEGAFMGVYSNDSNGNQIVMSPDAYNKKFNNTPPTKQSR